MRAGLQALADKSLPSLVADAEGEVAAAFKGVFKSLMGNRTSRAKSGADGVTKVPHETVRWVRSLALCGTGHKANNADYGIERKRRISRMTRVRWSVWKRN